MHTTIQASSGDDERYLIHLPLTGKDSLHKVVLESELDRLSDIHKEIKKSKSILKEVWLSFTFTAVGHFLSRIKFPLSAMELSAFDGAMLATGFITVILFCAAVRNEHQSAKHCENEVQAIMEKIRGRQVNSATATNGKKQHGKFGKRGR